MSTVWICSLPTPKCRFFIFCCFNAFTLLDSDLITRALITAWAFRPQTWARALREVIRSALLSDTLLTHARKPLSAGFILPLLSNWLKGLVALFIWTSITVQLLLVYLFKTGLGCAVSPLPKSIPHEWFTLSKIGAKKISIKGLSFHKGIFLSAYRRLWLE